ncbi:MAG: hypothetical protein H6Q56_1737 [Deltaproteobacteria bacterium]|jgi:hypothetical protein|nr:hypothetical protein [Deltaproteobacteria bacterium]
MTSIGRTLIILGLLVAAVGALLTLAGKIPWLGRLPGDIFIKKENFTFFLPITTCILLSALISFILWLLRR